MFSIEIIFCAYQPFTKLNKTTKKLLIQQRQLCVQFTWPREGGRTTQQHHPLGLFRQLGCGSSDFRFEIFQNVRFVHNEHAEISLEEFVEGTRQHIMADNEDFYVTDVVLAGCHVLNVEYRYGV